MARRTGTARKIERLFHQVALSLIGELLDAGHELVGTETTERGEWWMAETIRFDSGYRIDIETRLDAGQAIVATIKSGSGASRPVSEGPCYYNVKFDGQKFVGFADLGFGKMNRQMLEA